MLVAIAAVACNGRVPWDHPMQVCARWRKFDNDVPCHAAADQLQKHEGDLTMRSIDEEIARHLQETAASGELSKAEGYGKPMREDPGWDDTPPALRMPFKILKDAGIAPPEVAMFHQRAALAASVRDCADPQRRDDLMRQLSELEQKIALRLEALRVNSQNL